MVSWKGHLEPRMDKQHLASNLDLWPTVASLTGISAPKDLPGIDLTDPAAVANRDTIFGADFQHYIAKLGEPATSLDARYVIHGDWKLIDFADGHAELYDLSQDPWEKNDLADSHPEKVKALRAQLDAWWKP